MSLSNSAVRLWMLAVFASGLLVGSFGHNFYKERAEASTRSQPRLKPEEWRQRYLGDMKTRLGLDENQVQKLNVILDDTRERHQQVRKQCDPEYKKIQTDQVTQIRAMLNANQITEYEKFRQERDRRRQEERRR